ncbi:cytochrome c oxidase subunit II [Enterovirga aerilata]|uniref:cytochrome-c oxidase n=1 Tax=Enterovirga aerilata TaxID=2730920 RepID=A0A849IAQ8_9HYPH|nr:cytochrome c oxidase subunit II [Enterovirga sp. DB1703]NNM73140.1 cytochrome c oxidase subunit II [Enterovirga sp. DB1703]
MRPHPRLAAAALLPLLTGCTGPQSALDPQGPNAASLAWLIWTFTAVCGLVWLLVLLTVGIALWRRRASSGAADEPLRPESATERRKQGVVIGAVVATVLIIATLTLMSFVATRSLTASSGEPLTVRLRGYQWWWEVTYTADSPDRFVTAANEIRVPVGRPVRLELSSGDVIHSFWVPSLAGKQDMIPGRDNVLTFTAERPGSYRAQCAEFCGMQHARMALVVIAMAAPEFESWLDAQRQPAAEPADEEQEAGRQVATGKACAACHTIRGTRAAGTVGPDLTHVGSRQTIAAGTLPTTRGALGAWIADPQTVKPGNKMPMVPLSADELRAVSAYMAGLK